jgi:hypothetical protein
MKPVRYSACAWLVAAALGGCAGGEVESGATVRVTSPELVAVSPGVQVVADADEPLFYADGYYWLYRDGVWLRSDSYRGGFARMDVNMVPSEVREIPQPQVYAHYRRHGGGAYARGSQIRERAHSQPQGTYQQQQAQPQQPQQQQQQPMQPGATPTEPQPSSPSQSAPVPNPMPPNQGTPGAGTSGSPNTQGSQIPQNTPTTLPSQRDRDAKDLDRDHTGTVQPVSPTSPATTPTDHGKDKDMDKDKDKDIDNGRSDVDKNRSDLDTNKSGMDKSGMDRTRNDAAKDNNKKARGSDSNKKDKSDKDQPKDY